MNRKPTRPKILRDIDRVLGEALGEINGVVCVISAGVDFGRGSKVITHITVSQKHQRALGRWWERHLKWTKELG